MQRVREPSGLSSAAEERASAITHGMAAVIAVGVLIRLVTAAIDTGDARRIITVGIFGVSLVALYAASTCYHASRDESRKRFFRVVDHAGIYVLIAGSYTPFLAVLLGGTLAWILLAAVWSLAAYGVVTKMRSIHQSSLRSLSLYLGMGWIGVLAAKPLVAAMPIGCIEWMLAGGLLYTAGVTFYLWERLPFHHAVWHLFVAAGSACHVIAVARYVLPMPGR